MFSLYLFLYLFFCLCFMIKLILTVLICHDSNLNKKNSALKVPIRSYPVRPKKTWLVIIAFSQTLKIETSRFPDTLHVHIKRKMFIFPFKKGIFRIYFSLLQHNFSIWEIKQEIPPLSLSLLRATLCNYRSWLRWILCRMF